MGHTRVLDLRHLTALALPWLAAVPAMGQVTEVLVIKPTLEGLTPLDAGGLNTGISPAYTSPNSQGAASTKVVWMPLRAPVRFRLKRLEVVARLNPSGDRGYLLRIWQNFDIGPGAPANFSGDVANVYVFPSVIQELPDPLPDGVGPNHLLVFDLAAFQAMPEQLQGETNYQIALLDYRVPGVMSTFDGPLLYFTSPVLGVVQWFDASTTGTFIYNSVLGSLALWLYADLLDPYCAPDLPRCTGADVGAIGGTADDPGCPDNQLTVDDVIVFFNTYQASIGCPAPHAPSGPACNLADITDIGDSGFGPDGQLTVDDIIAFVNAFTDGCGN